MGKTRDAAGLFDKTWSWAERAKAVAEALGIYGYIRIAVVIAVGATWSVLVRILDGLPIWADCLLGLLLLAASLNVYVAFRKAWAIRGVKKLEVAELGKECIELAADILEFLGARQDTSPEQAGISGGLEAAQNQWERRAKYDNQTRSRLAEKFASRILAACHLLEVSRIKPPKLFAWDHRTAEIAAYFGAVGELLSRGLLDEARKFDPESVRL